MSTPEILLCAMLLDAALGEPAWLWSRLPHPAVIMGKIVGALDHGLNNGTNKRAKGCVCAAILVCLGCGIGYTLAKGGPVIEILVAAILLAQKSLIQHVHAVATGLRQSLDKGRDAVAMIVSRDTTYMDQSQTVRAAIESGAENMSDGVIAPAFWFCLGGLPALIAYKFINTADSMIGYRTPQYEEFGWAAARLDDLVNLAPARLTAGLIAIGTLRFNMRGIRADARLHRSPNAGWPEAAMARALGIALSGPRAYEGRMRDFHWVNVEGRKTLSPVDIDTSITILWKAWGLMLLVVAIIALLI